MARVIIFFHTTTFNIYTSTYKHGSFVLTNPSVSHHDRPTPQLYLITNYNHHFLLNLLTIKVYNVKIVSVTLLLYNLA